MALVDNEQSEICNLKSAIAFLFPGQGSQYAGMGRDLVENFAVAREVFEEADTALNFAISRVCFQGSGEELQLTENTQPAILTVSVAAFRVIQSAGLPAPAFVAGHSLGEYSALVAAGALSLADAVRTVRARGRYMQEAVPVGTGAMAAVIGGERAAIEQACKEASGGQVCAIANINSPNQVVIAGNAEAVERAMELLKGVAKRVIKLNVSAPFHCALMKPAQERLAVELDQLRFNEPNTAVVTNVDARVTKEPGELRNALFRQVSAPVRWLESIESLWQQGIGTFLEVGPGKVLSGLLRQINREANCFNVEDSASLEAARAKLNG
ncbi:MAG TPA: ACP S-malonyltransferase [Pyrinomonadaceae bacterium]|jgi:[acyl-carrier-protein] S-malonyltransferase|nr:ACP S-malonyltransferase [Pyrinomonadaceae bacterium]